ncbi:MAG TPA: MATE family efflux transporter [Rubricoccaceae bacterium]
MPRTAVRREVRATLVLALPLVLTQLTQMSMSFVDVVMVGRLGTAAMAAAVVGSTVYMTVMMVCLGVVVAVQPSVAQATGAGDDAAAARVVRQGLWLGLLLGAPFVVLLGQMEPILRAAGQSPETSELAARFLAAIRWGFIPNLWFTALRGLSEGVGRPRPVLWITLIGVSLNVALNPILIYGLAGAPEMGMVGSGWASAFAIMGMTAILAAYVFWGPLARYRVFRGLGRPEPAALGELFRLGWPIGITFALEGGIFTAATLLIGRMGEIPLAAHQIALNAASVAFMIPLGIGMAGAVRVGQAAGAGDTDGASRAGWAAIGLGGASMFASALVFWLAPGAIVWIYAGSAPDPEMARRAVALLGIAAVFQLFDGTQAAAAGALRGLKDTRVPMLIGAVSYWGLGLGLGAYLLFELGQGAPGMWWGLTLGLAAAAVLLTARFARLVRLPTPPRRPDAGPGPERTGTGADEPARSRAEPFSVG